MVALVNGREVSLAPAHCELLRADIEPAGFHHGPARALDRFAVARGDGPVKIDQNAFDNSITITPRVGAGEGQPCDEVPLTAAETAPAGSTLLSGGPTCNEVIRTINGIPGPHYTILAGTGVTVAADTTDTHRLNVDPHLLGLELGILPSSSEGD